MTAFRIAAAQVPSVRGDIAANLATHEVAVAAAAKHGVAVLVFPELSLIGYEPDLAGELAITLDDARLAPLTALARRHRMHVVAGVALRNGGGKPSLGAILFEPGGARRTYAKMHLGGTEPHFFAPGSEPLIVQTDRERIGLAICADSSAPSHPQAYADAGAGIYAAGVFLTEEWYATDMPRLADYASRFGLLVVMANHGASSGTLASVGRSRIWAPGGSELAEAEGTESCLLIAERDREGWCARIVSLPSLLRR